jgi:hypothetical protein
MIMSTIENLSSEQCCSFGFDAQELRRLPRLSGQQAKPEPAAHAELSLRTDLSAVRLDDLLGDRQPEPPWSRERKRSARQKRSNTCGRSASAMPGPVSTTVIRTED